MPPPRPAVWAPASLQSDAHPPAAESPTTRRIPASSRASASAASLPRTTAGTRRPSTRTRRCYRNDAVFSLPARGREAPSSRRRREDSPHRQPRIFLSATGAGSPAGPERLSPRPHAYAHPPAWRMFSVSRLGAWARRIHTQRGSRAAGQAPSSSVRGYRYSLARC